MKFIYVKFFDPQDYDFCSSPFWINVDHISKILPYDSNFHAPYHIDNKTGESIKDIPKDALDTIYVTIDNRLHHLDPGSSKKVLAAIKPIKRKK
jgi:hypothetical protein